MTRVLSLDTVSSGYGSGDIVKGVSVYLDEGEIVTVIGPNGAGKSTLIKTIAGLVPVRDGNIELLGSRTNGMRASEVSRLGMAYVPQEANVFRTLTVAENLEMGAWLLPEKIAERTEMIYEMFPVLRERHKTSAGNLSGGQRQMVALGMALMVDPKIVLLDEPSAGLSPKLVDEMFQIIQGINKQGVAVFMVEQNAISALRMSTRGYVLAGGQIKLAAAASALLEDTEVRQLYLGVAS